MTVCTLSPRVFLCSTGTPLPLLPDGALALPQISSEAFGDGSHPTTRLMAGAVDFLCHQRRPRSVLDVGTGTGILARIARARGATFVVATDIDPLALAAARANSALDASPIEIQVSDQAPDTWGKRFDLVIANILEAPLTELAPALSRALLPGGILLLSGFTRLQIPRLQLSYEKAGLRFAGDASLDGWALVTVERAPLPEPIKGEDFYYDDRGLFVFTEKYHLKKGYCCNNGCKHCPYDKLPP